MTPAARLSAAIDILSSIEQGQMADRVLAGWAKANRYAGSKDRAAIQSRVFDVLRNRARYVRAMGMETPRALIVASRHIGESASFEDVMEDFSGARFAPEPLSKEEEAALYDAIAKLDHLSETEMLNLPDWLLPHFKDAFSDKWVQEVEALNERAPVDLRVNAARTHRESVQFQLKDEGIETALCAYSPWGLRTEMAARVTHTKVFKQGLLEIQDEGSQLSCLLAGAKKGEQWVDLCAGAGGKTLALMAALDDEGRLVACDTDPRRLGRLQPRVERASGRTVEMCVLKPFDPALPDPDLGAFEGAMDGVFVDAPCSGSGAWRRQPEARWQLSEEKLGTYQTAQREVLARGARLVRPGGRMVYVTCSLFKSENEDQISHFLSAFDEFSLSDWQAHWPEKGVKPDVASGGALRLSPCTTQTDGFFIAILERRA
ncbi:RsmB/NOP family class I SAM-dependent RNA methyltransferase [Roseibium sp.]|uniref:RsmB/NOP family class I SAM-dependent RNA methyltransferase n=1 Tax=Roseibium sp. TaxID=1936156 RepID=UPI00351173D9